MLSEARGALSTGSPEQAFKTDRAGPSLGQQCEGTKSRVAASDTLGPLIGPHFKGGGNTQSKASPCRGEEVSSRDKRMTSNEQLHFCVTQVLTSQVSPFQSLMTTSEF